MLIISDLDDVILNTSSEILRRVNRIYRSNYKIEDCNCFSIEDAFNLDKFIIDKCVRETLEDTEDLEMVAGAINTLSWITSFSDLWIVSKRPDYLTDITLKTLTNKGLRDFRLFLSHPTDKDYVNKIEIANDLKADVFIEDSPETIQELYENTDCRILCMDRPWNQEIKENERIFIVRNWMEIRDLIFTIYLNGVYK